LIIAIGGLIVSGVSVVVLSPGIVPSRVASPARRSVIEAIRRI
jgi:hypothetical protein